jgi:hypothetical protein
MNVRSGIYDQALQSYAKNRARDLGYAREDLAGVGRGYDLAETQGLANYQESLKDLESDKARQIAADAQALLQLR